MPLDPRPADPSLGTTLEWAPAVGLLLGGIGAGVLYVIDLGAGPLTGAAVAVAALALLTRGLHLDGLADLADGLGSGKPGPAAVEIMRRSDIGPFGVVTLVLALLIQVAALSQAQSAGRGPVAVLTAVTAGRLAMSWACRTGVPAARPEGLGALVAGSVRPWVPMTAAAAGLACSVGAAVLVPGLAALPAAVVAGLAAAFALERHAVRRLGGITGDVLGGIGEVATTVTLLVAAMGPKAG